MGVVYKAQDTKLKRAVALKFLPPELTRDEDAKQRFMQEAQAASALDHPNICSIYEIDETADGQLFLAMAYYEGETLKQKIDQGPRAIEDVLDIGIQVGQGLARAHESGIVHRDIKPANIMVTRRADVKILDFGLAKLAGAEGITQTGTTLGTVAYMSPEQTRGDEVDQRSDVWALGVVLYEMITGQRPFTGEGAFATANAIVQREPPQLTALQTGVPAELERVVNRALSKPVVERYQTVTDLMADLRGVKRTLEGGTTAVAGAAKGMPSIAVLPFTNMSPDPEQEYFSDGLTEEIITDLSKIHALRVISRTSAMRLKGTHKDLKTVGQELNVRYLLEGSVRKAGHNLRHVLNGFINYKRGHLRQVIGDANRALAIDPNNAQALFWLGGIYTHVGREDTARPTIERLMSVDPLAAFNYFPVGWVEFVQGRFGKACEAFGKGWRLEPDNLLMQWVYTIGLAWNQQREDACAHAELFAKQAPQNLMAQASLFLKHALQGQKTQALQVVTPKPTSFMRDDEFGSWQMAACYALVDERQEALDWLEHATLRRGFINYPFFAKIDPMLENLRGEQRFAELMQRVKQEWQAFEV